MRRALLSALSLLSVSLLAVGCAADDVPDESKLPSGGASSTADLTDPEEFVLGSWTCAIPAEDPREQYEVTITSDSITYSGSATGTAPYSFDSLKLMTTNPAEGTGWEVQFPDTIIANKEAPVTFSFDGRVMEFQAKWSSNKVVLSNPNAGGDAACERQQP